MRWLMQGLAVLVLALTAVYGLSPGFDFLFEDQEELAAPADAAVDYRAAWLSPSSAVNRTWRPVARWTLLAQRAPAGLADAWPYRLVNLVLLGLAGVLAYTLMRRAPFEYRRVPAMLAGLAWILHPAATGAVYRIVDGRETLLLVAFTLGSLVLYFHKSAWGKAGALALYAGALGSRESAVFLPLLLYLAEGCGLSNLRPRRDASRNGDDEDGPRPAGRGRWRLWGPPLPFLVMALVYVAWRTVVMRGAGAELDGERAPWGSLLYVLQTTAAPFRAALHQPTWGAWWSGWRVFAGLLAGAGLVGLAGFCLMHPEVTPEWGRSGERRRLWFWLGWLLLGLPVWGGLWTRAPAFDELAVWPAMLGVWGVLGWVGTRVWPVSSVMRQEGWVFGGGLVVVLAALSFGRREHYPTDAVYASHWARRDTGAPARLARQGAALAMADRWTEADAAARRGLMLAPDDRDLLLLRLAVLEKRGQADEALGLARELARAGAAADRERVADMLLALDRAREASDLYAILLEADPENTRLKEKMQAALAAERGEPGNPPGDGE